MSHSFIGQQAVVVGAGMGGLAAAMALANHFEQVIVLERDELPPGPKPRTGTPQDKQLHGLLAGGLRALGALLPGIVDDLRRAGAVRINAGRDIRYEFPDCDPMPKPDRDYDMYLLTRPLLEFTVRQRVAQKGNVIFRQNCRVLDILPASAGNDASGVRYETDDHMQHRLTADLVVDASSSGTLTRDFLRSSGRMLPEETVIGVDIGYATAIYTLPKDAMPDWKAVITLPVAPDSSRSGYFFRMENGRWILGLNGRHDDKPPADPEGFLEYVRSLRTPTIYNVIKQAKLEGKIQRFGLQQSIWRHFDRLGAFPRGLLPIGDAICRFNPIYGQGMSVACQEAQLLDELLRDRARDADPLDGLGEAFFKAAQPLIQAPWDMSAVPDFIYPGTRGERPADFDDAIAYSSGLYRVAFRDPVVRRLILEVQQLLQPPSILHEPALMQRVKAELA
ncbi:NAD(P)/FAD-dependent oxidoreductase [Dongia soli]|uniref:FAD-binding protein n=1 Tax=Dongia soli TaxID=600628 RepID=A0ABU5EJ34_9PROT|nr:FAD-binding protein [Dongia soli]MDY0885787.1 FAD-binding protein [Dongia soli]